MTSIRLTIILTLIFCSSLALSQTITKKLLVLKLTNNDTKYWYKCGTLTKAERVEGDIRFLFTLKNRKFIIETCSSQLKWIRTATYNWEIVPETDNTPTGYHHYLLKIGNKYSSFRLDSKQKSLQIVLPDKKEQTCLN